MIVRVLKDTTLTVKTGEIVEVDDRDGLFALQMGSVEQVEKPKPKAVKKKPAK